jgi:AcrR family transcriptional regulator
MASPQSSASLRKGKTPTRNADRTRAAILAAATAEFSTRGLAGGRVDAIAKQSGANKRMIYHYFGDKEGLYLAVLEETYSGIRTAERTLHLESREPADGLRELVLFTWDYFNTHPEFLSLLATENLHRASFLKRSTKIRDLHSPLIGMLTSLLDRGARERTFRSGIDPVQLYISIAALGFFYLSNQYTLSTIFERTLGSKTSLATRRDHIVDVVLAYVKR